MDRKRLTVAENLEVEITPSREHEFLMTTAEVANLYGVKPGAIRRHKMDHKDELKDKIHFVMVEVEIPVEGSLYNPIVRKVFWTKLGIIRLAAFIRSPKAAVIRSMMEDSISITDDRLVDILADVAKVEDKALRLSIVNKLMNK